jgi:putative ABC transport system permease protein
MAVQTFGERWTLFVGTLLCVTLGVALVESSVLVLQAAESLGSAPGHSVGAGDISSFMGLTLTVACFLSVFVIGSTFAFTVDERRRDLALLRLSGATRRQLRRLLAGESVVVGILASTAGTFLGLALVPVQLVALRRLGMPTDLLDVRLSSSAVAVAVASGVGLSLLGAWVAGRRAGRVRPLDALRDVDAAARVMTFGRWAWGLAGVAVTLGGSYSLQASSDPAVAIAVPLLLIFSASIALQQLSPLVVPLVARLGGALARRHVEGEIAHANLVDSRRRAATTAGPLIVLVAVVVGLYGVVLTQTRAQVRDLELTTRADLVVQIRGTDVSGIAAVDGVDAVAPMTAITGSAAAAAEGLPGAEPVDLMVTDPVAYRAVMAPRLGAGSLAGFDDHSVIANGDTDGPFPGELPRLHVRTGKRSVELGVVGRTALALGDQSAVLLPFAQVDPAVVADAPTRAMVTLTAGAEPAAVRRSLIDAGYEDTLTTSEWAAGDQAASAEENRTVILGLAGLGGLYALLSVINAVALAAASRKREFAVAQVTGLTREQVVRTTVVESLGVGVIGVVLGAAAALTCLIGVRRGFQLLVGEPVLVLPWATFLGVAVVSLTAVAATAGASSWLATRTRPILLAAARE